MDLISAYRDGLADQLGEEARGLAGRPRDLVQRAIVYHHLYDHSGGRHAYALLAAEGALALDAAIAAMAKAAKRARWRIGRARSEALAQRVADFGAALAAIDAARCEAMWIAYRAAQHGGTAAQVPDALHAIREGDSGALFHAHRAWVEKRWGLALEEAVAALDWSLKARPVAAALAALRIPAERLDKAARKGFHKVEAGIIADKRFPAKFAANPAHHYYALQRSIAERRRADRDLCLGIPVEDTVRLAAAA